MKFWQVMEFHLKTRSLRACWIKRKLTIQKLAGLKILRIVRGEFLVEADGVSMKKIMCGQKRPQRAEPREENRSSPSLWLQQIRRSCQRPPLSLRRRGARPGFNETFAGICCPDLTKTATR